MSPIARKDALEDLEKEITVGNLVKGVRFADDKKIVTSTETGLQRTEAIGIAAERHGMKINESKTR